MEGASAKTGGFHDPPWRDLFPKLVKAAEDRDFAGRRNRAFWRGSTKTNPVRHDLVQCDKKLVDAANVQHKEKLGKPISAVDRTEHRYIVYMDGRTFSGGLLPMIPCGGVMLMPPSPYYNLFGRAFRANGRYRVIDGTPGKGTVCPNITATVTELEADLEGSAALAASALEWTKEALSPDSFETYMLKVLQAYAKLQRFTPKRSDGAVPVSMSLVKKNVNRKK